MEIIWIFKEERKLHDSKNDNGMVGRELEEKREAQITEDRWSKKNMTNKGFTEEDAEKKKLWWSNIAIG